MGRLGCRRGPWQSTPPPPPLPHTRSAMHLRHHLERVVGSPHPGDTNCPYPLCPFSLAPWDAPCGSAGDVATAVDKPKKALLAQGTCVRASVCLHSVLPARAGRSNAEAALHCWKLVHKIASLSRLGLTVASTGFSWGTIPTWS